MTRCVFCAVLLPVGAGERYGIPCVGRRIAAATVNAGPPHARIWRGGDEPKRRSPLRTLLLSVPEKASRKPARHFGRRETFSCACYGASRRAGSNCSHRRRSNRLNCGIVAFYRDPHRCYADVKRRRYWLLAPSPKTRPCHRCRRLALMRLYLACLCAAIWAA